MKKFIDILKKYDKIIIPKIQREYIFAYEKNKILNLFKSFMNNINKEFDFGALIVYEKNNILYIFDGQQRFSTIIFIMRFLNKNEEFLNKFYIENRESVNNFIKTNDLKINSFSTMNINNLRYLFFNSQLVKINIFDNFLENINFELIFIDNINLSEQILLDINQKNLKLTKYDLFKSKIYHKLGCENKKISIKIDNEWLNFFDEFLFINKIKNINSLELLVNFIIIMFYLITEKKTNLNIDDFNFIDINLQEFYVLETILDNLVSMKNKVFYVNNNDEKIIIMKDLKFVEVYKFEFIRFNGVFWNENFDDYYLLVNKFLNELIVSKSLKYFDNEIIIYSFLRYYSNKNINKLLYKLKQCFNLNYIKNINVLKENENYFYDKCSAYPVSKYLYTNSHYYKYLFGDERNLEKMKKNEFFVNNLLKLLNKSDLNEDLFNILDYYIQNKIKNEDKNFNKIVKIYEKKDKYYSYKEFFLDEIEDKFYEK